MEPILMEDVSYKDNVYSAREDVSAGLCTEELEKYGLEGKGYQIPDQPVDKCNVVRVAAYDEEGKLVSEATRVYFVGFQEKTGYDAMITVSIVTDPDNLFGRETGIYALGEKYEQYMETEVIDYWPMWEANYKERGREWEREATIDLFDSNRDKMFTSAAGIRIHGGMTRAWPQKSLNIYAREEYGGSNRFPCNLFQNGSGIHKFALLSGGNDDVVKIRDYIVQTMMAAVDPGFATMKMYPCVLFLNGEYWGDVLYFRVL